MKSQPWSHWQLSAARKERVFSESVVTLQASLEDHAFKNIKAAHIYLEGLKK